MVRITKNERYDESGQVLINGRPISTYTWKWTQKGPRLQFDGSTPYYEGRKVLSISRCDPKFITEWTRPIDLLWILVLSDGGIVTYRPENDEIALMIFQSTLKKDVVISKESDYVWSLHY